MVRRYIEEVLSAGDWKALDQLVAPIALYLDMLVAEVLAASAHPVEIVEADRNYVKITVGRQIFHARSSLQQAEKSLQSQPMLRVSRSCLVNMRHVSEISRTPRGDAILVLAGGTTVTSSEGFREAVKNYLDTLKISPR